MPVRGLPFDGRHCRDGASAWAPRRFARRGIPCRSPRPKPERTANGPRRKRNTSRHYLILFAASES